MSELLLDRAVKPERSAQPGWAQRSPHSKRLAMQCRYADEAKLLGTGDMPPVVDADDWEPPRPSHAVELAPPNGRRWIEAKILGAGAAWTGYVEVV
jgi:hypothetical protein